MRGLNLNGLVVIVSLMWMTNASAYVFKQRCSDDSLDSAQAIERIEWASRCNHITAEDRHDALFSGQHNSPRPRPQYPLFATDDLRAVWRAPVVRGASCDVPGGYAIQGFCTASCYTPDQVVLFPGGHVPIGEARLAGFEKVMALHESSSLDSLELAPFEIDSYTQEIRDTWHTILVFRMQSGGELKVTPNHPIVASDGHVRTADSFKVGEAFIHFEKGPDVIQTVTSTRFFGRVHNLAPKTEALTSQIVVAQGYLNGSSYYQNDGVDYLNRKILRNRIPATLLE